MLSKRFSTESSILKRDLFGKYFDILVVKAPSCGALLLTANCVGSKSRILEIFPDSRIEHWFLVGVKSLTDQLKSAFCSIAMNSNFPDLPDDGPEIRGGQPRYNIGDTVNVTCISRNSLPAAKLSWYINGEKADPIYLRTYPEETNIRTQLQTSTLGLTFKVNNKDNEGATPNIDFSKGFPNSKSSQTLST